MFSVKKIFHITTNLSGGGAETQMLTLVASLANSEFENYIVYERCRSDFDFDQCEGVKYMKIKDFKKLFRQLNLENVIIHIWIPDVFTYMNAFNFVRCRARTIIGIRNVYALNSLKRIYQWTSFMMFDNFVSNTPLEFHSWFYRYVYGNRFTFIPNTVKGWPKIHGKNLQRTKDFLFVGRLKRHKGILDLVAAHANLEDNTVRLSIAGEGPCLDRIKNSVGIGNIDLLGYSNKTDKLYTEHKFLVLPSYVEGMPNVIFEAAMNNCCLVLSDIPQHRFWFDDSQAFFFECGSIDALTELLKELTTLDEAVRKCKVDNASKVFNKLTHKSYINSYRNLYNQIGS